MISLSAPLLGSLLFAGPAHAGSGDTVLTALDDKANRMNDMSASVRAVTIMGGKAPAEMAFTLRTRGQKRLVEFQAPGDMKGTRVLVVDRTQMYVYLPAYNKVRRVASHVSDQGFMGTTFADADMSNSRFGEAYEANLASETDKAWEISLSPKADVQTAYAKIEMTVQKDIALPSEIRYFNAKGDHVKTETRLDYKCDEKVCIPLQIKMVDHSRADAATTLYQTLDGYDTGLSEDLFSVRSLSAGG